MNISPDEMTIRLKTNLRQIRLMLKMTATDFAEYMGITRQTVNNLENKKSTLNHTQVIAVLSIIDHRVKKNTNEWNWIQELLGIRLSDFGTDSFLEFWFRLTSSHESRLNTDRRLYTLYDTLTDMSVSKITLNELINQNDKIYLFYDFLLNEGCLAFLNQFVKRVSSRQKKLPLVVLRTHLQELLFIRTDETDKQILDVYEEMKRLKEEEFLTIENSISTKADFHEDYRMILQLSASSNYIVSILTENQELCEISQKPCYVYGLDSFSDFVYEI